MVLTGTAEGEGRPKNGSAGGGGVGADDGSGDEKGSAGVAVGSVEAVTGRSTAGYCGWRKARSCSMRGSSGGLEAEAG